ncbi:MAG: hypothetical protein MRY83_07805 [Flavobacteriales bacterium]|nr:hypothetical protein [Flavobacteriales bacterium]
MVKLQRADLCTFFSIVTMLACLSCNVQNTSQVFNESVSETKLQSTEIDSSIWVVYQDSKSNFWFGSKDKGAYRFNDSLTHFSQNDGLIGNQIRAIKEDSIGNIFFETTEGISMFDGESFEPLLVVEKSEWRVERKDIWFSAGYNKNGVYRYDGQVLHYLQFPKSPHEDNFRSKYPNITHSPYGVYCIYKDSKGHIWFGTSDMGVYRFDGQSMSYMYEKHLTETPEGGTFGIRSIAEDSNGFFWICNTNYKYKVAQNQEVEGKGLMTLDYNKLKTNIKEAPYFLSIVADNDRNLWMLTFDNGVWKNEGDSFIHYPVKDGAKEIQLLSIYKDKQGTLWLGTLNKGVYKFNGISFEPFNIEQPY